jgi:competence protein ComEA
MPPRLARIILLAALAAPPGLRLLARRPAASPACQPGGRGQAPRHWLGCAADPGPSRDLTDEERLLLGLPLDPNTATARALAFVPGLSRRLAEAVVAERTRGGPFGSVEDLRRVSGIGVKRLQQARPSLRVGLP